jgi:hypothetical protein
MIVEPYRDVCRGNSICIVERFKALLESGYQPDPLEVREVSSLLGEPTKKVDVFNSKYLDVFTRLLQKNCIYQGDVALCIYSWNPRARIRYFPIALDATGTILLFEKEMPQVVAYPTHRAHDIALGETLVHKPEEVKVAEVTARVDGFQITFYYNPLIKRWVPATRYVLHNMRYVGGRLITGGLEEVINPYAKIADLVAEKEGIYDKLRGYEGWTFTFVLEAPEPAILRPNVELYRYEEFKLYLLNARRYDGLLLTVRESSEIVKVPHIPIEEVSIGTSEELERYISKWSKDLYVRSRFIRYANQDPFRPYTVEVGSKLYEDAVAVKFSSSPKSLLILASYGFANEAVNLLVDYRDLREVGRHLCSLYFELREYLAKALEVGILGGLLERLRLPGELLGEVEKARRTGDVDRLARKVAASLAADSIYQTRDRLLEFLTALKNSLRLTTHLINAEG